MRSRRFRPPMTTATAGHLDRMRRRAWRHPLPLGPVWFDSLPALPPTLFPRPATFGQTGLESRQPPCALPVIKAGRGLVGGGFRTLCGSGPQDCAHAALQAALDPAHRLVDILLGEGP